MQMTAEEFKKIAAGLQTAFPWANMFPTFEAMEIWYRKLRDIPFDVMSAVVNRWIDTKTEPPSIAALRKEADLVVNGAPPQWADGWEKVLKAVGRYGYMNQEAALASMDSVTQETVRRIGWQEICMSENPDAIRANFREAFKIIAERMQEERLISAGTRNKLDEVKPVPLITGLADKMKMPTSGGKEDSNDKGNCHDRTAEVAEAGAAAQEGAKAEKSVSH